MKNRPRVFWALLASGVGHGLLLLALSHWPAPTSIAAAAVEGSTYVFYPSSEDADPAKGQLAPGDNDAAQRSVFPGPLTKPIVVEVSTTNDMGPLLPGIGPAEPGRNPAAVSQGDASGANTRQGSAGGGATTTFFGVPARGQRLVYVLDRSGSMGFRQALATACQELEASLAHLPATAWFQVIAYNSRAEVLVGPADQLLPATPENLGRVAAVLKAVPASGGTKHLPALQMALGLKPDVIYFLTDADDLDNEDRARVTQVNGGRCVINTIELTIAHRGRGDMPMQRLARDNRGTYQAIDLFP
jgi:hypothetical protein